ncbi:hypothetical protein QMA02_30880 [Bacillus wiedmannii]|uniref:hypothetical protein n=1 Tax=Bacillus wiedmannii TaxID=1890302 RepID=UPI0024ACE2F1|nr:hypothetical protein [Bacillus wiedmannii]MDI6680153.1 hypothetical protein [Bacillus wiedmannii]
MKYGVYLAGEVMATNEDYFEALKEAEYLTKDTGVVHWVMPIKEEAKWDEQRVKAYIKNLENNETDIELWEKEIIEVQKRYRYAIVEIERLKRQNNDISKGLYDHGGWMRYDGEWVEVDKE